MSQGTPTIPAKVLVIVFVVMMAGAAIFAWSIVRSVRRNAAAADEAARIVAWSILASADHEGAFPTERAQLEEAFGLGRGGAAMLLNPPAWWSSVTAPPADAPEAWPTRIETISIASGDLPEGLRRGLRMLSVQFAADPRQPPLIGGGGQPTSLGTLGEVNGWLRAWAEVRGSRR